MRRIAPLVLSLIVPVILSACGGDNGGSQPAASVNASAMWSRTKTSSGTSSGGTTSGTTSGSTSGSSATVSSGPGFPVSAPWMTYYGDAPTLGSLSKVANTFRIMDIDLDPDTGNFAPSDVVTLKNNGQNKVLSYLNLGSCEHWRGYWNTVPSGFVSCGANKAAQLGSYQGYSDETWMNVGNADYQNLIVNYVAPRLVAQGADGFYLDNLEIVEHGTSTRNGPCDAACAQGGLDLVRKLREKYPTLVFVMQNATGRTTREGVTGGVAFASLLDGIAHEEVYAPKYDASMEAELAAWKAMALRPNGHAFWIATLDYVGGCEAAAKARRVFARSRAMGFVPYASDASARQGVVCYWER